MSEKIVFGNQLSIAIEVPKLEDLNRIKAYREKPKFLKNKTRSRLVEDVPTHAGIYFLFHKDILLYIGNGANIRQRINFHSKKRDTEEIALQKRLNPNHIDYTSWIKINDKIEREIIETIYLNKYPTAWNSAKRFKEFDNYPKRPWDKELELPEVMDYIKRKVRAHDLISKPEYLYKYCKKIVGKGFEPPPLPDDLFDI